MVFKHVEKKDVSQKEEKLFSLCDSADKAKVGLIVEREFILDIRIKP